MNFNRARNSMEGLYSTFLESGGTDLTALELGASSAWEALRSMSAAQVEGLTRTQQQAWGHLVQAYQRLPEGIDGPRQQRRWLESAREILLRVPA